MGENNRAVLSPFQEMVLTLMRLRLNLTINDLSYRFNISRSTTSSVVLKWINVMFVRLRPPIMWPGREEIISTTPVSFRQYFKTKVTVIIDCFEIFINKPTNLKARNATWSQYKHHNTIKLLIGISPKSVITLISKARAGRTSDKYLTENSKFLNSLLPGDVALADRGFDIAESVRFYCAEGSQHLLRERNNCLGQMLNQLEELLVSGYISKELLGWLGINTQYYKANFLLIVLSQKMVAMQQ